MKIQKNLKNVKVEVLMFLLCFMLTIYTSKPAVSSSFPKVQTTINETTLLMPDWNNISFGDFPPINQSGNIDVTGELRTWKKGQTPDQFLKLQDINSLFPNKMNLTNIMEGTKDFSLIDTSLDKFPLVGSQTVEYLLNIVPGLGKTKVKNVPPIYELFKSVLKEKIIDVENLPLSRVVQSTASLGNLTLNAIDLSKFPLALIKNIETVILSNFKNWEKAYINQIPGLNKLPLAKYPVPLVPLGNVIGTVKFIWGKQDNVAKETIETISGSYKVGFKYSCKGQCSNINLSNIKGLQTTASWVWGKQLVDGGNGCLSNVNQGKEPTGRNPYGSLFKVVVDEVDDNNDKASTALYFRFANWCGATPYVVGPVPFQEYGIDSSVFLGSDNDENVIDHNSSAKLESPSRIEPEPIKLIDVSVLAQVIAEFNNSNYNYISDYLVNGDNSGRILGLYSFRSYDPRVMMAIKVQPGGAGWLKSIESGKELNPVDVSKYFSPAIQDSLFIDYLNLLVQETDSEIDPNTGKLFDESLLERVLEKVYFGKASLVNAHNTNAYDEQSSSLIKTLLENYHNKTS